MHTTDLAAGNLLIPNGTFIIELIIFAIVLFVMWRYVVPPVVKALQDRADRVARTAKEQQEAAEKLAAAESRYAGALTAARREASEIRAEARAEGQQVLNELRTRTDDEVSAIQQRSQAELAEQRERALRELRGDIGSLSTALAGRVIGVELPADSRHAETVAAFLDGLTAGRED